MEHFKKLNSTEKRELLDEVHSRNLTLHFKFEDSSVYKAKLLKGPKGEDLKVKRPTQLPGRFHRKVATVIIAIDQERYFLVSSALVDMASVQFSSDGAIYHLQRRKLRRTAVPGVYPASLMIKKVNGTLSFLKGVLLDISDAGLKVGLNSELPAIKTGWEIVGTLRLGTRRGIEIKGKVRHQSSHPRASLKQVFGLEMIEMSEYAKTQFKNQLLDFQRDIFIIFMGGQGKL